MAAGAGPGGGSANGRGPLLLCAPLLCPPAARPAARPRGGHGRCRDGARRGQRDARRRWVRGRPGAGGAAPGSGEPGAGCVQGAARGLRQRPLPRTCAAGHLGLGGGEASGGSAKPGRFGWEETVKARQVVPWETALL